MAGIDVGGGADGGAGVGGGCGGGVGAAPSAAMKSPLVAVFVAAAAGDAFPTTGDGDDSIAGRHVAILLNVLNCQWSGLALNGWTHHP